VPIPDIDTLIRTKTNDRLRDKADSRSWSGIKVLRSMNRWDGFRLSVDQLAIWADLLRNSDPIGLHCTHEV